MNNNDVMKKLRVALQLRDDDIVHILSLVDFRITKTELSGIFRAEDHENFKPCGDQILRNFLNGLIIYKCGDQTGSDKTPKPARPRTKTDENKPPKITKQAKKLPITYEKRSTFIKPVKKKSSEK